jgi:hypothetical protein
MDTESNEIFNANCAEYGVPYTYARTNYVWRESQKILDFSRIYGTKVFATKGLVTQHGLNSVMDPDPVGLASLCRTGICYNQM